MGKSHSYILEIRWTGNNGSGTSDYKAYERSHTVSAKGKPEILASSDPSFRGDMSRYNPEELFVASISSCHMLWFLHLCAEAGVVVLDYVDNPVGTMVETADGGGKFEEVVLNPIVSVRDASSLEKLDMLHKKANEFCFIANSVNFNVKHCGVGKVM